MIVNGKAFWFKAVGPPRDNKFKPESKQWAFDLAIDEKTAEMLLDKGMSPQSLKDKKDERGVFITFTRDATRADGSPGKPIEVVDSKGQPWPDNKFVGNGSTLNVKMTLNEREFRGKKFLKPGVISVQVWDLVAFSGKNDDFPVKDVEDSDGDVSPPSDTETW